MSEPNMTCAVCGGTWGEPNPVLARWRICPADCHDETKWKALLNLILLDDHERIVEPLLARITELERLKSR